VVLPLGFVGIRLRGLDVSRGAVGFSLEEVFLLKLAVGLFADLADSNSSRLMPSLALR
jgi:hypothetical protein